MPDPARLFAPAAPWTARSSDPNDLLLAHLAQPGPGEGGVALFGLPFDGAVLGRRGAREGPAAIREQMGRLKAWTLSRGALSPALRDWGDVLLPADDVPAAHEATLAAARAVQRARAFPLALGGDHSLTFPLVKALGRRVGVINLDAHLDVRDHAGVPNSGTSFGRLLAEGIVPGGNLVEVGVRDFANAPAYADKVRKAGGALVGAAGWMREGLGAIDRAIEIAARGVDGVYLSVDLDVLDQAHAPGVSAPTPGGVDTATLFAAIRRIAERAPLVGADFMEVAPPLDRDGMTSRAAAYAAAHLLAGLPPAR